jgi:hypothetical protein
VKGKEGTQAARSSRRDVIRVIPDVRCTLRRGRGVAARWGRDSPWWEEGKGAMVGHGGAGEGGGGGRIRG